VRGVPWNVVDVLPFLAAYRYTAESVLDVRAVEELRMRSLSVRRLERARNLLRRRNYLEEQCSAMM
jgi:hypothetical protein